MLSNFVNRHSPFYVFSLSKELPYSLPPREVRQLPMMICNSSAMALSTCFFNRKVALLALASFAAPTFAEGSMQCALPIGVWKYFLVCSQNGICSHLRQGSSLPVFQS